MKGLIELLSRWHRQALGRLDRDPQPDEAHQLRVGFLLVLLLGGVAVSLVLAVFNFATGSFPEGVGALGGALVCLAVLFFWAKTGRLAVVTTFYGVAQVSMFVGSALALGQPSYLAWLALGPMTLLFFAGRRTGAVWLVISVLASAVAVVIFSLGLVPVRPDPEVSVRAIRAALSIPIIATIGFLFETVRLRTMESLHRARDEAERANRDKDRFLVGAHQVLRINVKDTGPGIRLEDRDRLFKPFGQLAQARGLGGTGLGLAMCHELAQVMGGVIELDSTPGQGSTFALVVPLQEASGVQAQAAVDSEPRRFTGRALVVDDNAINNRVATVLLSQAGLDVTTAANGCEALEQLTRGRFDIVFMDVHMPVMDGHEATRELRRREQVASLPRTPVIALTASALQDELNACFAAGMDDGLAKPISVVALQDVLRRFVPQQGGQRAAG